MIREALTLLARELNSHLQRRFRLDEEAALLSSLIDQDGSISEGNKNRVIISLIHLDQETNRPYDVRYQIDSKSDKALQVRPPIKLNLNFICASNFGDYEESLKFLSESVAFFHEKPVFDPRNTPSFPGRLERLNLEVENIDYSEFHNIWTAIGAKYTPSMLYKARLVTIGGERVDGVGNLVAGREVEVR